MSPYLHRHRGPLVHSCGQCGQRIWRRSQCLKVTLELSAGGNLRSSETIELHDACFEAYVEVVNERLGSSFRMEDFLFENAPRGAGAAGSG